MRTGATLIFRNTAANYVGTLLALLVSFFLTPFIISKLGQQGFGLWALVGAVMTYGSLLDLGIDHALTKYVGEHSSLDDVPWLERVIHTTLTIYLGIGAAVLAFTALAAWLVPLVFALPEDLAGTARTLVLITGTSLAINFPLGMYNGILQGLQRYDIVNAANVLWSLGTATGAVIVLSNGGGLIGLGLVYAVGNTLGQAARIGYLLRRHPHVRWMRAHYHGDRGREIFSFSFYAFLIRGANLVKHKTDEIVVGLYLPIHAVGHYSVGIRLTSMLDKLASQLAMAIYPYGSNLDAGGEREALRRLYVTAGRLNLAIALPMGLFIGLQASRFIEAWVGPGFEDAALPARLLIGALVALVAGQMGNTLLTSMGRHQTLARLSLVEAACNLALSLALVRRWGLTGVAAGTLIPAVVFNLGFVIPHSARRIGVEMRQVLTRILAPQIPPATAAILVSLALAALPGSTGLVRLLGEAAVVGAVYWTTYITISADVVEKDIVRTVASRVGRAIARRSPADGEDG